ncbi:Mannose-6-phosphate isomerase [Coemansia sp. RSA 1286]|nr:Mannose-6-phosphate isomerase [Coemansia sp. RSA 1286]
MVAIRLACAVNNYHWGKHGLSSKAAQFAATNPEVSIDDSQTYAELWMGTHPSGPSKVFGTDTPLSAVVDECSEQALGPKVASKYQGQIPYLFKVLSIEKALSIQAHPDKQLAQKLHSERPSVYKDGNHKPEMSIALTDFIAMSGFRPLNEISGFLDTYPEFQALVSNSAAGFKQAAATGSEAEKKQALKQLFAELMNAAADDVARELQKLVKRIGGQEQSDAVSPQALVVRLNSEYPDDVGVFCVFMLNVLCLQPGDAFYMGPNDPHAYVSGDCIECMATSDNVIRAGLTPKMRDVPVLVDMLTYDHGAPDAKLLKPTGLIGTQHSVIYDPPIEEFAVIRTQLEGGQSEKFEGMAGPQILIVVDGEGVLTDSDESYVLAPGYVFFVVADSSFTVRAAAGKPLVAYTATCQL